MSLSGELTEVAVGYQDYLGPDYFWNFIDPAMIETARSAAEQAISYRQFHVGACAAVLLTDRVVFLEGFNSSPRRGSTKRCAEMHILQKTDALVEEYGHEVELLDLYVAGPSDPEQIKEVTGRATPTLHSCRDCLELLDGHQTAGREHTRITTFGITANGTPPERHTLGQMLALYHNIEPPKVSRQLVLESSEPLGASALY